MVRVARAPRRRGHGGGVRVPRPGRATWALMAACAVCTLVVAHVEVARSWLLLGPWTLGELEVTGLVTGAFVARPEGPFSLLILVGIAVMLSLAELKALWAARPGTVLGWIAGAVVAVWALDAWVVPGLGYGLVGAVVVLGWIGSAVERAWGDARLLRFALIVVGVTGAVGALWAWLAARPGPVLHGERPLMFALLTVWALMHARQVLPGTQIAIGKLVWLLVAFGVLDALLVGAVVGVMELLAIGLAVVLVRGWYRPAYVRDRIKLWRLERRRRSIRVIDGGRLHRGPVWRRG